MREIDKRRRCGGGKKFEETAKKVSNLMLIFYHMAMWVHVTCLGHHLPLIIPCLVINPTTPIPSSHNFMCLLCSPIPSNNCTTTHKGRWKPCLYLLLFFLWSLCEEEEGEWCCSEKGPFLRLETQTHWHSWGIPETKIIFWQWGLDGHVPTCSYPRGFWVHKRSSV